MNWEERLRKAELYLFGDDNLSGYTWEELQYVYGVLDPENARKDAETRPELRRIINGPRRRDHRQLLRRWPRAVEAYAEYLDEHGGIEPDWPPPTGLAGETSGEASDGSNSTAPRHQDKDEAAENAATGSPASEPARNPAPRRATRVKTNRPPAGKRHTPGPLKRNPAASRATRVKTRRPTKRHPAGQPTPNPRAPRHAAPDEATASAVTALPAGQPTRNSTAARNAAPDQANANASTGLPASQSTRNPVASRNEDRDTASASAGGQPTRKAVDPWDEDDPFLRAFFRRPPTQPRRMMSYEEYRREHAKMFPNAMWVTTE